MKRLIIFILSLIFVFAVASVLVAFGRGYRLNLEERKIEGTGILTISSTPEGAEIYLDGDLRDGTDASIPNLSPGKYSVRLEKTGFNTWEKEILIEKEKVTPIEVVLFPSAPDLSALTFSGVVSPVISPDSTKVVYAVTTKDKAGIWVLEFGGRQLFSSRSAKQIAEDADDFKFSQAKFEWSSDSGSLLVTGKNTAGNHVSYLLDSGRLNGAFDDVSIRVKSLREEWAQDLEVRKQSALEKLGEEVQTLAKGASKLLFSPDEKRVLIIKKNGNPIVYDSNPSLVPGMKPKTFDIPKASGYVWLPTSHHIVLIRGEAISIVESDGQNDVTIFTGAFSDSAVFPWPDSSKLVIVTTLNTAASKQPNLYSIRLR